MDVRAATAMAKSSVAVHGAASLCGLLPLNTKLGRSLSKTSQANSQIHRIIFRRAAVKATSSIAHQIGSGDPSIVDAEMIVLRKRMQKLNMQEIKYAPPQHWMKWEEWSITYASDISDFLRGLENILINTGPRFAIVSLDLCSFSSFKAMKCSLLWSHWLWSL